MASSGIDQDQLWLLTSAYLLIFPPACRPMRGHGWEKSEWRYRNRRYEYGDGQNGQLPVLSICECARETVGKRYVSLVMKEHFPKVGRPLLNKTALMTCRGGSEFVAIVRNYMKSSAVSTFIIIDESAMIASVPCTCAKRASHALHLQWWRKYSKIPLFSVEWLVESRFPIEFA